MWTSLVRGHNPKADVQRIRQTRNPFRPAWILADDHTLVTVWNVHTNPLCDEWLCAEVVDGALEEALHLGGVQVDGYDVVHAGDFHEVGEHAGGDGAAVRLLLRLARVGEVGHDG